MHLRTATIPMRRSELDPGTRIGAMPGRPVEVTASDSRFEVTFDYPRPRHIGAILFEPAPNGIDVIARWIDRRWETLRQQAKRKGRPGWRRLRPNT